MEELPDPDSDGVVDDPYPFYRELRDRYPVHRHPRTGEWLLTRFADVRAAALDPVTFSSEVQPKSHDHMASLDPPRHDRHRAAVAPLFHVRALSALAADVEARCRALLVPLATTGALDLGAEMAAVLPSAVVSAVVGIPDVLAEPFRRLALTVTTLGGTPAVYQAIADLQAMVREALEGHPLPPGGILARLAGGLASRSSDLSARDVVGICTNLVLAGTDTASNLITNAVVLLWRRPDLRRQVASNPALVDPLVEEVLRFESPVQWLSRRTTRPVSLYGVSLPVGSVVRLCFGAANRDERAVDRPDELDPSRSVQRHLAFGCGLHFCLGAPLARLEARSAVTALLAVAPDYAIDEAGLVRIRSSMFRGHEHVPVRAAG